jgi:hypothetical protein
MRIHRSRLAGAALSVLILSGALARAQSNQTGGEQLNPNTSANTIANGGSTGAGTPVNRVVMPVGPLADPNAPANQMKDSASAGKPLVPGALQRKLEKKKKPLSDRRLKWKLRDQIAHDRTLSKSAQDVRAKALRGIVTLTGTVENDDEKYRIAAMAALLVGPENVVNVIAVKPPSAPTP